MKTPQGLQALIDDGVIDEVLRPLKSGKEAAVYVVRSGDDVRCAKVYKDMDGWPNRDLNVGAIIALSPVLPTATKVVYNSWGPGKYDPRFNIDGLSTPMVLPPAYGLARIKNETYTAEGPISYWNAYVAVTQMGGQGNFSDPRLGIHVVHTPDLVTPKLPALRAYQHSLKAPPPPIGSYDPVAATRGRAVFGRNCMLNKALASVGSRSSACA